MNSQSWKTLFSFFFPPSSKWSLLNCWPVIGKCHVSFNEWRSWAVCVPLEPVCSAWSTLGDSGLCVHHVLGAPLGTSRLLSLCPFHLNPLSHPLQAQGSTRSVNEVCVFPIICPCWGSSQSHHACLAAPLGCFTPAQHFGSMEKPALVRGPYNAIYWRSFLKI